jgi:hypothetical protein
VDEQTHVGFITIPRIQQASVDNLPAAREKSSTTPSVPSPPRERTARSSRYVAAVQKGSSCVRRDESEGQRQRLLTRVARARSARRRLVRGQRSAACEKQTQRPLPVAGASPSVQASPSVAWALPKAHTYAVRMRSLLSREGEHLECGWRVPPRRQHQHRAAGPVAPLH